MTWKGIETIVKGTVTLPLPTEPSSRLTGPMKLRTSRLTPMPKKYQRRETTPWPKTGTDASVGLTRQLIGSGSFQLRAKTRRMLLGIVEYS